MVLTMTDIIKSFSSNNKEYSKFRPDYPKELYEFIIKHTQNQNSAWDCATGTGQAAAVLAEYFDIVYATDAAENQIKEAIQKPNIKYTTALSNKSYLKENSIDLITIAQALHWFANDETYKEIKKVAKKDAVIAAWCYTASWECEFKNIAEIWSEFYSIIRPYFSFGRHYIDEKYETILFPFKEIKTPKFFIKKQWGIYEIINYAGTFSALKNYVKQTNTNPIEDFLIPALKKNWPENNNKIQINIPIHLKLGKVF